MGFGLTIAVAFAVAPAAVLAAVVVLHAVNDDVVFVSDAVVGEDVGGGALGSYQLGAYQALKEKGFSPNSIIKKL